jgi:hypothetical protein
MKNLQLEWQKVQQELAARKAKQPKETVPEKKEKNRKNEKLAEKLNVVIPDRWGNLDNDRLGLNLHRLGFSLTWHNFPCIYGNVYIPFIH